MAESKIGGKLAELIALTVANANGCDYCNAAHSFIGEKLAGIDTTTIQLAKKGKSNDFKTQAALTFSRSLLSKKGNVTLEDVDALKEVGYSDGEITEIIAYVDLNIFTNYFNNAINVTVDFPEAALVESVLI